MKKGFRNAKAPYKKTHVPFIIEIIHKGESEFFQVKTRDQRGQITAIYKNTVWRLCVILFWSITWHGIRLVQKWWGNASNKKNVRPSNSRN